MTPLQLTAYAVLLPFIGFLFNGLVGRRLHNEAVAAAVGCATVGAGFVVACLGFVQLAGLPPGARTVTLDLFTWIAAGAFRADVAFQVDQLSIVMMLIVTGVGFLIHVYSAGYMHGDPGFARFFAYLNLFIFAMLTLILAACAAALAQGTAALKGTARDPSGADISGLRS